MRLVMLGYFGFGNAGDEALLAAEVQALRLALPGVEFVVVSGDVAHTRRVHGLPAVSRTDFGALAGALRSSSGLVAGGGSLLQDVTSARPVPFYAGTMLAARLLRKPVFVYAQGLGPLRGRLGRVLSGRALRASTYVSLRDTSSVELASALGADDVELVPDPVLALEIPAAASSEETSAGRPVLAVALRPWDGESEWAPLVGAALKELAVSYDVALVPFHAAQDLELARSLASDLGSAAEVVEPDGGYLAPVTAIGSARVVLGMRLHALIAAAATARPFVALAYDPKVTAFARRLSAPIAATLPGPVDVEGLVAAVRTARPPDAETLARLRTEATRPAAAIASRLARK